MKHGHLCRTGVVFSPFSTIYRTGATRTAVKHVAPFLARDYLWTFAWLLSTLLTTLIVDVMNAAM
jgi:hypothetical protein